MAKVKTVTNYTTPQIKKEITSSYTRNKTLRVHILGYVTDGNREPFEADEVYYCVSVSSDDYELDIEVVETTSLAKAKQRQLQLYNALHGYRGNVTKLVEYDENNESFYSDY